MSDIRKYQTDELLNKVLNSGEDALKVDIDNVTLTTEGGDVAIDVALDKANDSITIYSNTSKDGSGTSYVPLVDSDGHLQVDSVSTALPSGAATAANQATIIGHVDGVETLLGNIDSDTNAIKTAVESLDNAVDGNYLNVNANIAGTDFVGGAGAVAAGVQRVTLASDDPAVTDLAAIEVLLTGMDADTDAIKTDIAALEVLSTAANVDLAAIEVATEASQSALEKMLYGTALAVTAVHGGSDHSLGATYEAFYIGVGGDISLDCATSGANIVFKNVASGQILPVRATVVNATNTTATNIVALKA